MNQRQISDTIDWLTLEVNRLKRAAKGKHDDAKLLGRLTTLENYIKKLQEAGFSEDDLDAFISVIRMRTAVRTSSERLVSEMNFRQNATLNFPNIYHPLKVWRVTSKSLDVLLPYINAPDSVMKIRNEAKFERMSLEMLDEGGIPNPNNLGEIDFKQTLLVIPFFYEQKYTFDSEEFYLSKDMRLVYGNYSVTYFNSPLNDPLTWRMLNVLVKLDHGLNVTDFILPRFTEIDGIGRFYSEIVRAPFTPLDVLTWVNVQTAEFSLTMVEFADASSIIDEIFVHAVMPPISTSVLNSVQEQMFVQTDVKDGMGLSSLALIVDLSAKTPQLKDTQYDISEFTVGNEISINDTAYYQLGVDSPQPITIGSKLHVSAYSQDVNGHQYCAGVSRINHPMLSQTLQPFFGEEGVIYSATGQYTRISVPLSYSDGNDVQLSIECRLVVSQVTNDLLVEGDDNIFGVSLPTIHWFDAPALGDPWRREVSVLAPGVWYRASIQNPQINARRADFTVYNAQRGTSLQYRLVLENRNILQPGNPFDLTMGRTGQSDVTITLQPYIVDGRSVYRSDWQSISAAYTMRRNWTSGFNWEVTPRAGGNLQWGFMSDRSGNRLDNSIYTLQPTLSSINTWATYRRVQGYDSTVLSNLIRNAAYDSPRIITPGGTTLAYAMNFADAGLKLYDVSINSRTINSTYGVTTHWTAAQLNRQNFYNYGDSEIPPQSQVDGSSATPSTAIQNTFFNQIKSGDLTSMMARITTAMQNFPQFAQSCTFTPPTGWVIRQATIRTSELILPEGFTTKQDVSVFDRNYGVGLMAAFFALRSLEMRVENLEAAIEGIYDELNNIWDQIKVINSQIEQIAETIEQIIEAITPPPPSKLGIIGQIFNVIGGIVSSFFPLVGTMITLVGTFVTAAEQFINGDILGGSLTVLVGSAMGGLTAYKFGKRYMNKINKSKNIGIESIGAKKQIIASVTSYRDPRGSKIISGDSRGSFIDIPNISSNAHTMNSIDAPPSYVEAVNSAANVRPPPYHSVVDLSWSIEGESIAKGKLRMAQNSAGPKVQTETLYDVGTFRMFVQNDLTSARPSAKSMVGYEFIVRNEIKPTGTGTPWGLEPVYTILQGEERTQMPMSETLRNRINVWTRALSVMKYQTYIHEPELLSLFISEHPNPTYNMKQLCDAGRVMTGETKSLNVLDDLAYGLVEKL